MRRPDCKAGRPDLDFGQGFYVTLLQDQAEGFAKRKARESNQGLCIPEF